MFYYNQFIWQLVVVEWDFTPSNCIVSQRILSYNKAEEREKPSEWREEQEKV